MSINLHLTANRELIIAKTGELVNQSVEFELWQTPTDMTEEIINSGKDILQVYIEWVKGVSNQYEEDVYAYGDIFHERKPIGTKTVDPAKDHINELIEWINKMELDGFDVEFSFW